MKADLHIHSIYSDGEDSPKELINKAKEQNLELVSLTDHDTIDGLKIMEDYAKKSGIKFLKGIELSTFSCAEIHILGYNMDTDNTEFINFLNFIKQKRKDRLTQIITKLNSLNINITEKEVYDIANFNASVGRLHIAKILVKKGVVKSISEAFDKLLGLGKCAYVPYGRIKPKQAIDIINNSGGKAVLAHPYLIEIKKQNLLPLIKQLIDYGISGIEAGYYAHNKFEKDFLTKLCEKFNLIATCGSDYHGKFRQSKVFGFDLKKEDYIRLTTR